jgi:uncharacterized protein (DUF2235 family)
MASAPQDFEPATSQDEASGSIGGPTIGDPRNIILFSDGTGNSSAKLFKTNVWRMYEAVDFGKDPKKGPVQIAYYDNGVGTQSLRALAILAGIFGIGLKVNVLRLYRFACRNATKDSRIFCFGFSRGAFTIRLVAALIASQGLVEYQTEDELNVRSLDAFRRFMRNNNPNVFSYLGTPARALRDWLVRLRRKVFGPHIDPNNARTKPATVAFIGVWDTVAAYGGPFAEITRGIDDYIYPLTMTDYRLDESVQCARHALALDDERDSFSPLLWDELDWKHKADRKYDPAKPENLEANAKFRDRLKQVWFAGMHSDVGGGYPDESLSYVSLCWMMAEAEVAGLRLLSDLKSRIGSLANSLGPIHDSRQGLGSYYRPQPRKIAAFMHPLSGDNLEAMTLSLRDPVIGELQEPPHGQLLECRIHESVITRIASGTDDYAPLTLPPKIAIERFSSGIGKNGGQASVDSTLLAHLEQRDVNWWRLQERIWNRVWLRRVAYFLAVLLTLVLVSLPVWIDNPLTREPDANDGRWLIERLTSWSQFVVPDMLLPWVRAFEINVYLFCGLILGIVVLSWIGSSLKRSAWTESRVLWDRRLQREPWGIELSGFAAWRTGRAYQWILQLLKWRIAPPLAALVMSAAIVWVLAIAGTQIAWSAAENDLCKPGAKDELRPVGAQSSFGFGAWEHCVEPRLWVERGRRYEIAFAAKESWRDASVETDPMGATAYEVGYRGVIFAPMRRIIDANYLQPLLEIRPQNTDDHVSKVVVKVLDLRRDEHSTGRFSAIVTPTESGELFLFANDAALLEGRYYNNNCGTAVVTIRDLDAQTLVQAPPLKPIEIQQPRRCLSKDEFEARGY